MVTRCEQLHEGKGKILYATEHPDLLIQYFKDDATAFNAKKRGTIHNKGVINNHITAILFQLLEKAGVKTHFVKRLSDREMCIRRCRMYPLEVVMRNIVAGSLAKRTGHPEGEAIQRPILEYYYKDDALGDPMISTEHIQAFGWATETELGEISTIARAVNTFLTKYFSELGILLVDFKLEFGRGKDADGNEQIMLADEITPDSCRLWDRQTREKLDKDRFRFDLGRVEEAYQRVYRAVCASIS